MPFKLQHKDIYYEYGYLHGKGFDPLSYFVYY